MSRFMKNDGLAIIIAAVLVAPAAMAQDQSKQSDNTEGTQQTETTNDTGKSAQDAGAEKDEANAPNLSALDDGEWINLTGTVKSVAGDEFTLNYGENGIIVEMDDFDIYNENMLLPDDEVTVSGRMDEDFFNLKSIEASSVYVPKLGEYFFASAADEEEGGYVYPVYTLPLGPVTDDEWVSLVGTVTSIDGDEMVIDAGLREYAVDGSGTVLDTGELIDVGDRVSVTGEMDDVDLFDRRELEASSVVILTNNML